MKKWFNAALLMLLIGAVMVGISLKRDGLERFVVNEDDYEKMEYICRDEVSEICIKDSSQDIEILVSAGDECRLAYLKSEYDEYTIELDDGALLIERDERISILNFSGERVMRLYLPEGEYKKLEIDAASSDVKIDDGFRFDEIDIELSSGDVKCCADADELKMATSSGNIELTAIFADSVELSAASGDMKIADTDAKRIEIATASGSITLEKVEVSDGVKLESASGDIWFAELNAGDIYIDTASGDVEGSVAKPMLYEINTTSGDIDVPVSMRDAAVCRVETTSGDIRITEE